jgi:outer membrane protein
VRRFHLPLIALSCAVLAPPALAQDLAAAIADAQANAPTLAEAQAGEAAAGARLDRARSEANPLVRIEGTAGVGRIDNGGFFGITADNVNPLAVQAMAEMPLYTGGRIGSAVEQANGGSQVARFHTEQTRLDVGVQAVAAYTEVLTSRQIEQNYKRLVAELTEVERQAGLRFRVGEIASSDVAQAKARRAEAEAGLAAARGRRLSAEAAFERLTGKAPGDLAPLPASPPAPPSLAYALDLAHTNNPALKQADQAVVIAEAGRRGAKAEAMPTVGAFAEAAYVRGQFFPGYRANSVAVGVRGRWTLFSGGRNGAQVRAADAEIAGAEARARQTRQTLDGMVIDAWHSLETADRMIVASEARVAAANEALRGTRLEAQVGVKPTLAVLDAEREATEAQTALLEAQGRRHVAAWRLNALTGFGQ